MSQILLNTAYFPNIQYMSKFVAYDKVIIEVNDTYAKQTYRNRCVIYSANGSLPLSIPVIKNNRTAVKDVQIDYIEDWQKAHYRAILSAYKNSAYYDFIYPDFENIFIKKEKFLIDLNNKILDLIFDSFGFEKNYQFTDDYIKNPDCLDFRDKIHPKKSKNFNDSSFKQAKYYQVFEEKYGFIENLSVLDLLFNEGPIGLKILQESIV
ncbi:MAG: hypothetical protein C0596_17460 [Marinilabiliales bacterium]|nr:MAG: hypothetical protein C0596_17460 [Marinilabiliales bacterium]